MTYKALLATVTSAISLAKTYKNAELVNQLIEVQRGLLESYDDATTVRAERDGLASRVVDLEQKLKLSETVTFFRGLYYPSDQLDGSNDIPWQVAPYCVACRDVRGTLVHLAWTGRQRTFVCPECKHEYEEHHR